MLAAIDRRLGLRAAATVLVLAGLFARTDRSEAMLGLDPCDAHEHVGAHGEHAGPAPQKRGRFEALPDVTLSNKVEEKLNTLADRFQKKSGRTFVVTSGTRGPEEQADVFVAKLEAGDDVLKLYKDKAAVLELKRVFDVGRAAGRPRPAIVAQIATTIRAQMKRGVFISAHLKAGAADVRSSNMTNADKRAFVDAAREVGGVMVLLETVPPHFHLQMD